MNLGEVGWGDVDWIGLDQDRNGWRALVNLVFNGLTSSSLSSSAQLHREYFYLWGHLKLLVYSSPM
jgi:hypothetical protein